MISSEERKIQTKLEEKMVGLAHQCSFQAGSVMVASAHDQYTLLLVQLRRQLLDLIIQTEDLLNQI